VKLSKKPPAKLAATTKEITHRDYLGQCNTNGVNPMCVASPKVAKVSNHFWCRGQFCGRFCRQFQGKLCQCKLLSLMKNVLWDWHQGQGPHRWWSSSSARFHRNTFRGSPWVYYLNLFSLVIVILGKGAMPSNAFFAFSLIIEGTTEKVLQFILPLKSIYNQILVSLNKKCIFEH